MTGKIKSVEEGVKGKVRLESGDEFENPEAGKQTCACKSWKRRTCGPQAGSAVFSAYIKNMMPRVKYLTETKNHILGRSENDRAAQALKADFVAMAACESKGLTECTPCQDDDEGVKAESGGNAENCEAAKKFCQDLTYGSMAQKNCPKTCGLCTAVEAEEELDLQDTLAGAVCTIRLLRLLLLHGQECLDRSGE